MSNRIYFRRSTKVIVHDFDSASALNFAEVASLDSNLRTLGYTLDGDLAARLLHAPVSEIKAIHDDIVREAKEIKGVRRYVPMYPNFPTQVMEADEAELYINAVMHYFGTAVGLRVLPKYERLARPELDFDESKFTRVGLGFPVDFDELMANLFASKSAFSETDRADLNELTAPQFTHALNLASMDGFKNRENKATLFAHGLHRGIITEVFVGGHMDTATDVLRLAAGLSDGDVSLSEKTKFRNFSRPERRFLLTVLRNIKDAEEDMGRHASAWKRLGEKLHPGEHGLGELFKAVRDNAGIVSFNSRVEAALPSAPIAAARLLQARPGEFARRLDAILRKTTASEGLVILAMFEHVAHLASPTVLLQARNSFVSRAGKDVRAFFPKGSIAKMKSIPDNRGGIKGVVMNKAVGIFDAALVKAFAGREDLGGSYVDPALKGIAIPFGGRNASKAVKTIGRGSRLSLGEDAKVIRFFIWWKDAANGGWGYGSHTDIDLSAVSFGEDFSCKGAVTFYNLRENGAVHSGDITSAPNGASEFIDIDIDKMRARGVRYIAMTLHSYSGQGFVELPECFAGFMERSDLGSGEIYDPRTVTHKVDLTADTRGATPFIFDLETGEAIWVDLSMQISEMAGTVNSTKGQITSLVEAMTTLTPPNMYDLFTAHAVARGGIVSREQAKTVFAFDGDVTPFDTELILDKYL